MIVGETNGRPYTPFFDTLKAPIEWELLFVSFLKIIFNNDYSAKMSSLYH